MGSWKWMARYIVVLVVTMLLGAAIAELAVFKQTTLGTPKLPASALARFLGSGGALIIFWFLGRRTAQQLCSAASSSQPVGALVLPLTTLVVLSAGYDVALAILWPFLDATGKDIYNWIFVASITASAIWLIAALYRHAEGIVERLQAVLWSTRSTPAQCPSCNVDLPGDAGFCPGCGKAVAG